MGFFKGVKKVAGHLVDVRFDKWMSLGYLKDTSGSLVNITKDLIIPQKSQRNETFEQALVRLNLTEEDILQRKKEFARLSFTFMIIGFSVIGYGIYMGLYGNVIATLISFCLSLYAFSQAFRFNFWLFQIKNRKLGCTFHEWWQSTINGDEH